MEHLLPPVRIGTYSAPVIPDVLQEHLEEVAFLSIQARKLLFSPDITLAQFRGHGERIAAHWHGLQLGGEASVMLALDSLEAFDPWEAFAAARVWMELGSATAEEITQRIEAADEDQLPAWREALARMKKERLVACFPPDRAGEASPKVMSVLAYAWGWRGLLPDEATARFGFSADPLLRRSAARVLGWGAAPGQAQRLLSALLTDPEVSVRRAALWSLCLLAPPSGVSVARKQLESQDPDPFSARVLGLLGSSASMGALQPLVLHENVGPACIRAMGDLGDPGAIELLIDLLEDEEERAEAARDAIETILGAIPGSGEEAKEETVGEEAEEEKSPAGTADGVRKAWREAEAHFQGVDRLLRGYPFPWAGAPPEEPMEAIWRDSLAGARPELAWLRNEVPDGFFDEDLLAEAVPGE